MAALRQVELTDFLRGINQGPKINVGSDEALGGQFPQIRHLRSRQILASKEIMLVVWLGRRYLRDKP